MSLHISPSFGLALLALALPALTLAQAARETAVPPVGRSDTATALERCEASVTETLRKLRGSQVQDVQFVPTQRAVAPADDGEISVKGTGRYRARAAAGGNSFTFSCSYNVKTALTSGVVLREAGGGGGAAAGPAPAWLPDLSRFSPEACESAVAQELKARHPRVAQIALEPDTRRLEPGPGESVVLFGQGAVQRAPGMNAVPFNFSCEVNPRSGRVVAVKTSV